jgi:MFS family permease
MTKASAAGSAETIRIAKSAGLRKAVAAATLGTVIEWFDYALYGAAAGIVINKLFFPEFSAMGGVLAAFATFAVGFFIRPLGGVAIAHLGDRFGRRPAMVFTIALMGSATLAMGLLPTFVQVGVLAPVLLVILRLLQGFGAGAEYAGAVTLVSEYTEPHERGFFTALLQSASLMGIMLATLSFLAVSAMVTDAAFMDWGWRLPFFASGVLSLVALYLNYRLDETPEYVSAIKNAAARRHEHQVPIKELFRNSPRELVLGFMSVTGHNANAYILSAFVLSYMINTLGMPRDQVLIVSVIAATTGIVCTPLGGALADRIGNLKVYALGAAAGVILAFPLFLLIDTRDIVLATIGISLCYALVFGLMAGAQGAFLANLFPTQYRFSGITVAREMNGLLIAGPTPFIATGLVVAAGGKPTYVILYLMACCAATLVALYAMLRISRRAQAAPASS